MAKNSNLQHKFCPVWVEDFECLNHISERAFLLRILYCTDEYNKDTQICDLSDLQVRKITGWDRKTIRKARRELISSGYIKPIGYHRYLIRMFHRLSTGWGEFPQPDGEKLPSQMGKNSPTRWGKTPQQMGKNSPTLGEELPNPINNRSYTDNTDSPNRGFKPVENLQNQDLKDQEIPYLLSLFPFNNREQLKRHLEARGFTENAIGKIFERVYPKEYTGKT